VNHGLFPQQIFPLYNKGPEEIETTDQPCCYTLSTTGWVDEPSLYPMPTQGTVSWNNVLRIEICSKIEARP